MAEVLVRDVMTHLVVTLRATDTVRSAAQLLVSNQISGAPVVEAGRLVGVVSEADLIAAFAPSRNPTAFKSSEPLTLLLSGLTPRNVEGLRVADVMTDDVISTSPDTSVWQAAATMDRKGVRRLPVVNQEGFVTGIIARADVVRAAALEDDSLVRRTPA
jgi:CBS domain-containing protein